MIWPLDVLAADATWSMGTVLPDGTIRDGRERAFGDVSDSDAGYAAGHDPAGPGESGSIVMRPPSGRRGAVSGVFPAVRIGRGGVFHGLVRFRRGTGPGSVRIRIFVNAFELSTVPPGYYPDATALGRYCVADLYKTPGTGSTPVDVDLSNFGGALVSLRLLVELSEALPPGQEVVWEDARLDWRPDATAPEYWMFRPVGLDVVAVSDELDRGADPCLMGLYFRSVLGRRGSTKVVMLDTLDRLASDLPPGSSLDVDPMEHHLFVADVLLASADPLRIDHIPLAGLAFSALDLAPEAIDNGIRAEVRRAVAAVARQVHNVLARTVETASAVPSANQADGIRQRLEAGLEPEADGSFVSAELERTLRLAGMRTFGRCYAACVGLTPELFAQAGIEPAAPPNAIVPLAPATVGVRLSDEGGNDVWDVRVSIQRWAEHWVRDSTMPPAVDPGG